MASSKEIQQDIKQLEQAIQPTTLRLDQLYREFGQALPAYVETWMRAHVKRAIEDSSEKVNAGELDLKQIKSELNELVVQLPGICEAAVGERSTWPHHPGQSIAVRVGESRLSEAHAAASFRKPSARWPTCLPNTVFFASDGKITSANGKAYQAAGTGTQQTPALKSGTYPSWSSTTTSVLNKLGSLLGLMKCARS